MFDIITIGSVIRDIIFKIDKIIIPNQKKINSGKSPIICFRYGAKINPEEAYFLFGGGANNVATALSRLKIKTAIFSRIGSDGTGQLIVNQLKKEGVNTDLIQIDKKLHTALSFIIVGRYGERTIFPYAGASGNLELKSQKLIKKLTQTKWFYLTTLRNNSQKILPKIYQLIKKNKIKLFFNPGNTELENINKNFLSIIKLTDILLLNKEESLKLLNYNYSTQKKFNYYQILKDIKNLGPKIVILTDGDKGAWAIDEKKYYFVRPYPIKVLEKTGAGDSFGAGFLAGYLHFNQIEKALILASLNSASVIADVGSTKGLLNFTQAKKMIKKNNNLVSVKNIN